MHLLRIGHWQLPSLVEEFEKNLARFEASLAHAARERVRIVSFPECFLTGYPDSESITRRVAFSVDSPQMMRVLDATSQYDLTAIVGFNELRGSDLYNTAAIASRGHLLGTYSKCTAYQRFHKQGREFPVFEQDGVRFGVIICSDGGFIEPARILALQGARIIFAPHYNYIGAAGLIDHYRKVRCDHVARAVENCVHFVRGNNVSHGPDPAMSSPGIGYGDSYIVDPMGQMLACSRLHQEDFIFADVDVSIRDDQWGVGRSAYSAREFGEQLRHWTAQHAGSG